MSRKPEAAPVLGPRLRRLCGERGLSCSELARRSGLGVGIVRRILNAGRPVQPAERRSLARALRVKIGDLVAPEAAPGLAAVAETPRRRLERERDELLAQVEQLQGALTAERDARAAELVELRDQHMRELALIRSRFHDELVKALGEAQEREEKLAAALNVALEAIDRLGDGTQPAPPAHASGGQASSVVETLAGVAAGIGGLALTTVLLRAKRC